MISYSRVPKEPYTLLCEGVPYVIQESFRRRTGWDLAKGRWGRRSLGMTGFRLRLVGPDEYICHVMAELVDH